MKFKSFINWNKTFIVLGVSLVLVVVAMIILRNQDIGMFGHYIPLTLFIFVDYVLLLLIYFLLFDDFYRLSKDGLVVYRYVFGRIRVNYHDVTDLEVVEKKTVFNKAPRDFLYISYVNKKGKNKRVRIQAQNMNIFASVVKEEIDKLKK